MGVVLNETIMEYRFLRREDRVKVLSKRLEIYIQSQSLSISSISVSKTPFTTAWPLLHRAKCDQLNERLREGRFEGTFLW